MFALVFRFPAGRYHATPWGRNVNEADVAWPPEPWRILRALIATWWRKGDRDRWSEDDLAELIDALAGAEREPLYQLPDSAVHAHTRHYMPAPVKTTLVFDAFARLPADAEMVAAWPSVTLAGRLFGLAAHLAEGIGYLGRAESWVECRALAEWDASAAKCRPEGAGTADGEPVRLIAPLSPADYAAERERLLAAIEAREGRKATDKGKKPPTPKTIQGAQAKEFGPTLPARLLDALTLDTSEYQRFGWSRPPASRELVYLRQPLAPTARPSRRRRAAVDDRARHTVARFVLAGRPRPRIEDSVKIGELMRLAALSKFGRDAEGRWAAPDIISGRDPENRPLAHPEHAHAFFLPEDADGDGLIDHVVVFAQAGFDPDARSKLDCITRLWVKTRDRDDEDERGGGRKEWRLALEGFGMPREFAGESRLLGTSRRWQSVTPYLMPWHAGGNFGIAEQIKRELAGRGLLSKEETAALRVTCVPEIKVRGRELRPIQFHRFRSRRGLVQPDKVGHFVLLESERILAGPLALGFACHFGLGLFVVAEEEQFRIGMSG